MVAGHYDALNRNPTRLYVPTCVSMCMCVRPRLHLLTEYG